MCAFFSSLNSMISVWLMNKCETFKMFNDYGKENSSKKIVNEITKWKQCRMWNVECIHTHIVPFAFKLDVFGWQLSATSISLFIVLSFCRFSKFKRFPPFPIHSVQHVMNIASLPEWRMDRKINVHVSKLFIIIRRKFK